MAPDTLKQILLTLVQNAREAMPDGGPIEIRVGRGEGGTVAVDVLDEGPGIPADVLPRIFDPFFTTKGDVQGVGLGLFVAEGLVRRHSGRLRAWNREGAGAHFRVELPVAGEDAGEAGKPAAADGGQSAGQSDTTGVGGSGATDAARPSSSDEPDEEGNQP